MGQASPKILWIDIEKAFPNVNDQERLFPIVPYLDSEGLTLLHGFLRTKLVLGVIGHDRRNPDVKSLQLRLTQQWKILEKTIKKLKLDQNGKKEEGDPRLEALTTLKLGFEQVKH